MSDGYLVGVNYVIILLGFDMLQTLLTRTPAIRPINRSAQNQNRYFSGPIHQKVSNPPPSHCSPT